MIKSLTKILTSDIFLIGIVFLSTIIKINREKIIFKMHLKGFIERELEFLSSLYDNNGNLKYPHSEDNHPFEKLSTKEQGIAIEYMGKNFLSSSLMNERNWGIVNGDLVRAFNEEFNEEILRMIFIRIRVIFLSDMFIFISTVALLVKLLIKYS